MESSVGTALLVWATSASVALVAALAWLLRRQRLAAANLETIAALSGRVGRTEAELGSVRAQLEEKRAELEAARSRAERLQQELGAAQAQLAEALANLAQERSQTREKLALLQTAREALAAQFEVLGQRIFEEKSARFAAQNRESLGALLAPLGEQIKAFEARVNDVYDRESKERFSLKDAVRQLAETSAQMGRETENLTKALKGGSRTQGVWGELVLERVLAASGLRRGEEYEVQESFHAEDGSRLRPDVIVNLPDGKCIVIDSKVSLTAYERHCSAGTDEERDTELRRHLESVRAHVRALGSKSYQTLPALQSLDFVLMFVPIESAFVAAIGGDRELATWALNQRVLLVCPSTLLAAIRLIAHVWSYERQNRNAREIARLSGQMYDKLVGFVEDLESIGDKLDDAQSACENALRKLHTGRGNLVRTAEKVRELGVTTQKSLPSRLREAAEEEPPAPQLANEASG